MNYIKSLTLALVYLTSVAGFAEDKSILVSWEQIDALAKTKADHSIQYGSGEFQFGELRLPKGEGPFPVVVFVHGGCWLSDFDLHHAANLSGVLTNAGIAVWTPEYRRVGNPGGGWPGTLQDLSESVEYVKQLAGPHNLDLDKVVLMGHSAGGHLVLWYAAKKNLPETSQFHSANPLKIKGIVSLAGITDIAKYRDNFNTQECNTAVPGLLDGEPVDLPERVAEINPISLTPLNTPVRLIHGAIDSIVPVTQSIDFLLRARASGDDVELFVVDGAGHFNLIAPFSTAWKIVEQVTEQLLKN